ncbi:MAG: sortase [Microbacterium sp.]|nr:sortase [Microbacterium sp.]
MLEEEYEKSRRRLPVHLRRAPEPERPFSYEIRPATEADIPDIREIYNYYVRNSVVTFDEKAWSIAKWRDKFATLQRLGLPFLVAESPSGQVLGYALVQPWQSKSAYRYTVENSIYLGQAAAGKGLGRALLEALIAACQDLGIREMVAACRLQVRPLARRGLPAEEHPVEEEAAEAVRLNTGRARRSGGPDCRARCPHAAYGGRNSWVSGSDAVCCAPARPGVRFLRSSARSVSPDARQTG